MICVQAAIFFQAALNQSILGETAIAVYLTQQNCLHVVIVVIGNTQSVISQIFGVVSPLEENLDLFSPLGFDIQRNSDHESPKIKSYSFRALKHYLNEKILIHGQVAARICNFSA